MPYRSLFAVLLLTVFFINTSDVCNSYMHLSPNTVFNPAKKKAEVLLYIRSLFRKYNASDKDIESFEVQNMKYIVRILKEHNWDFEAEDFNDYTWFTGMDILLGVNPSTDELWIISLNEDMGKVYGFEKSMKIKDASFVDDKAFRNFVEEIAKGRIVSDIFKDIRDNAKTNEEYIKKRDGFLRAVRQQDFEFQSIVRKALAADKLVKVGDGFEYAGDIERMGLKFEDIGTKKHFDRILKAKDTYARRNALRYLSKMAKAGNEAAVEALIDYYNNHVDSIPADEKKVLCLAMGAAQSDRLLDIIIKGFNTVSKFYHSSVFEAMAENKSAKAEEFLVSHAVDNINTSMASDSMIKALAAIGTDKCVDALLLHADDLFVGRQCLEALVKIGTPKVVYEIFALLVDESKESNYPYYIQALRQIKSDEAVDALLYCVMTKKDILPYIQSLVAIGGDKVRDSFQAILNDKYTYNNLESFLRQADLTVREGVKTWLSRKDFGFYFKKNKRLYDFISVSLFHVDSDPKKLLHRKVEEDWFNFGVSVKSLRRGFMFAKNQKAYKSLVKKLFGKKAAESLDTSYYSMRNFEIKETYFPLKSRRQSLIRKGIDAVYGYLENMKFDTDVKLGAEYEIIGKEKVPRRYYGIFPRGADENEIITYPSHPFYQDVFSEHIPSEYAGVHRTVEQKVDFMDAKLIVLISQLYSLGMINENIIIGKEINPEDTSLWSIRYDNHVGIKYGKKVRLMQSTDWKNHMSGKLLWYFMNYADAFPLKWSSLRELLLAKLKEYDVNIYDYNEKGLEELVSIQKQFERGYDYKLLKYQYNLTKIPDGKNNSVMRLIINDPEVVAAVSSMIIDVTENTMHASKEYKQLAAFEALKEIHEVVARGEIPDQFAKYRETSAFFSALDAVKDVFTDYEESDSEAYIRDYVAASV